MDSSPGRQQTFGADSNPNLGPGLYDDRNYDIANNTKSFTIGERRETRVSRTLGPGAYSPERADSITRTKVTNINMGTSDLGTRLE